MAKATPENVQPEVEREPIFIPEDPQNPKNTQLEVCINGVFYSMRRGERIMVKPEVAELLHFKRLCI